MEQAMFPQNENNTLFDNEALFDAEGHLTDEGLHALQESGIDGWRPVHSGRGSFAITNEEE